MVSVKVIGEVELLDAVNLAVPGVEPVLLVNVPPPLLDQTALVAPPP